jgi:hypothetical protein
MPFIGLSVECNGRFIYSISGTLFRHEREHYITYNIDGANNTAYSILFFYQILSKSKWQLHFNSKTEFFSTRHSVLYADVLNLSIFSSFFPSHTHHSSVSFFTTFLIIFYYESLIAFFSGSQGTMISTALNFHCFGSKFCESPCSCIKNM